jgi:FAD binding domain
VCLAAERGWPVSVRSGGHSWAAWSLRDDALLIDLGGLRDLAYDPATGVVSARPAIKGGLELAPFLAERGRAFPGGGTARRSAWAVICSKGARAGTGGRAAGPDGTVLLLHTTAMASSDSEALALLAPLQDGPLAGRSLGHVRGPTSMAEENLAQTVQNPEGYRYAVDCTWTDAPAAVLAPDAAGAMERAGDRALVLDLVRVGAAA